MSGVGVETQPMPDLQPGDVDGNPLGGSLTRITDFSPDADTNGRNIAMDILKDSNIAIAWEAEGPSIKSKIISSGDDGRVIYGSDGNDRLSGLSGNDTIYGKKGNDIIYGDLGDDTLVGGPGADTLTGGLGSDTASYVDATYPIAAVLLASGQSAARGDAVGDRYDGIENLAGSSFSDYLIGDDNDNILSGGPGNDQLTGYGGNDTLELGTGNFQYADGGRGIDIVSYRGTTTSMIVDLLYPDRNRGEAAGDSWVNVEGLAGGSRHDHLYGTHGDNILYGDRGNDQLYGRGGNDVLNGGYGTNILYGGSGKDEFRVETPNRSYQKVADFSVLQADAIAIKATGFRTAAGKNAFSVGALHPSSLVRGSPAKPVTAAPVLLYDTGTGTLSFDKDGTGAAPATEFMAFVGIPDIQAKDISVY